MDADIAFDLPAQALASALLVLCQVAGLEILTPSAPLDGRISSPVRGAHTPEEALARLLRGTGCTGEIRALARSAPLIDDAKMSNRNDRVVLIRCDSKHWAGV